MIVMLILKIDFSDYMLYAMRSLVGTKVNQDESKILRKNF